MIHSARFSFSNYSYLFGIFLLAAALPFSKFIISISQIVLLISWLSGGTIGEKIKLFTKNKTALIISSLFVLHIIGLAYTSDFNYGIEDVRKKIPLLLLPLIFSTSAPLSKPIFEKLLSVFTLSVIIASLICFFVLLGYTQIQILQPRDASIFISHIRFGLLISVAIFILAYFFVVKNSFFFKMAIPILIIWFILFLIMIESATGLSCVALTSSALLFRFILKTKKMILKLSLLSIFILSFVMIVKIFSSISRKFNYPSLSDKNISLVSKKGNAYISDTVSTDIENGNYVWLNVCEKELTEEWNKKSKIAYNGKDLRGNGIKFTLIRFITSKGLKKDADGLNTLSEKEIKAIEKGVPNVNYMGVFNPTARMQEIFWELNIYLKGGNPSGYSVAQRFEFWKAAIGIIKENFFIGVGTGDVEKAFDEQYEKINSPLTQEWRLRSHNQFLAIGTAFGVIGILWFLIALFYPLLSLKNYKDYFYLTFFIISFLSMLTEDTLETQVGITFFAFFNSLFLFCREDKT